MSCTCVRNVNRQLVDCAAELATLRPRDSNGRMGAPRILVRTFSTTVPARKPPVAVATHCPFCGTKYKD